MNENNSENLSFVCEKFKINKKFNKKETKWQK